MKNHTTEILSIVMEIVNDNANISNDELMDEIMKRGRGHLNPKIVKETLDNIRKCLL